MINASLVKELRDKTGAGMMDCKKALEATGGVIEEAIKWLREQGIVKAQKKGDRIAAEGVINCIINENRAVLYEVNCETDFVAQNEKFLNFVKKIGEAIVKSNATCIDCVKHVSVDGETVDEMILNAIATIGEKITLRRLEIFEKDDKQGFGKYVHFNWKYGALVLLDSINEEVGTNLCMQIASMNPKYLDSSFIPKETLEEEFNIIKKEAELDPKLQGKPQNVIDNIIRGRVDKSLKDICLVNQEFIDDASMKVSDYLTKTKVKVLRFARFAVGEGIEKKKDDFVEEVMKAVNG